MPIDGSDAHVTLDGKRLIERPTRITPNTPVRKHANYDRGNRDRQPSPHPPPHDIVEVSPASHSSHDVDYTLLPESDTLPDQATEHHLDIQA